MAVLYIMRHGQTDWNLQHKLQGQTDIPLNENGRQMAKEAGEKYAGMSFDICYASPLLRARETAEIFLTGTDTPIVTDERLKGMCFGSFEGTENIYEKPDCPLYQLFKDPKHYVSSGGAESFEELYARTGAFLKEVIEPQLAEDKTILIVGHGAANSSIINQFRSIPLEHFWDSLYGNCELTLLYRDGVCVHET